MFVAGTTLGTFTNTVTATSGSLSGTATVIVTAGPLATITVTPNPVSLVISTTQQYTAVGKDVGGNVVAITPTWSVVAGGGTINLTTGLFTAGTVIGTYTNSIRANVGGLAGFATVLVTSGPLANITVTPNPVFMQTNATQQFVAVGKDLSGNAFLMTPVWSVAAGGGTIDPATGLFTAGVLASTFANTVTAKRLGILRDMLPTAKRIAVLLNSRGVTASSALQDAESAAVSVGLSIDAANATNNREIDEAFASFVQKRPDALLVLANPLFTERQLQIVTQAAQQAIPAMYYAREFAEAGGLIGYGASLVDSYRQMGIYAARVLKGEKPTDLPVLQPTKFEFVINLLTAKAIGLDIPSGVLAQADRVVE